jgi:hypothetical protein
LKDLPPNLYHLCFGIDWPYARQWTLRRRGEHICSQIAAGWGWRNPISNRLRQGGQSCLGIENGELETCHQECEHAFDRSSFVEAGIEFHRQASRLAMTEEIEIVERAS